MPSVDIKDTIHKQIIIEEDFLPYFESYYFQRLRYIKQISCVDFVYPNSSHSRLSHSLGVFHLMKKFVNNGLNEIDPSIKKNLILSALLHDIGHGPFSHTFEQIFPHFNHEKFTIKILRQKLNLPKVADILEHLNRYSKLLSSTIDVDKLDYMARDSYNCGLLSSSDPDYIITNSYVNKDGLFVVKKNSVLAVEDLITKRVNLYKVIYFHRKALLKDFLLEKIFMRIKFLLDNKIKIEIDKNLLACFLNEIEIENLVELDDNTIWNHIKNWEKSKDEILKILCKNFLNKSYDFEIIDLKTNKVNSLILKKDISKSYEVNYFFGHIKKKIKVVENQIYVETQKDVLRKIEDVSQLIRFYRDQNFEVEYLFYPKNISPKDIESLDTYFKN